MAIVSIDGKNLVVTMTGINKVAALKSRIDVPLAHVRGATEDPGIVHESKGLRAPGTHVPGIITAGTFHQHGERIFWDVTDGSRAIVIEFVDEDFAPRDHSRGSPRVCGTRQSGHPSRGSSGVALWSCPGRGEPGRTPGRWRLWIARRCA